MEKNMMVLEIMNLYDEVERLRTTVEWLSRTENKLENNLIEYAKERLFKNVIWDYTNAIECKCVDGEYVPTSYNIWLENVTQRRNLPDWMSFDEFVELFKTELIELYKDKVNEAILKAKEKHNGTPSED